MIYLKQLIDPLTTRRILHFNNIEITGITIDSRTVHSGSVYIAIKGFQVDGHRFISNAINQGAVAIVCEELPDVLSENITYIHVTDCRRAEALIARAFFDYPDQKMAIIGITGTNGKTSTTYILEHIFQCAGYATGLIGTIGYKLRDQLIPLNHTTPDSIDLYRILSKMVDNDISMVLMEVSSHALSLNRCYGIEFHTIAFTNFSQDHLDFYSSMDHYFNAKKMLFTDYQWQNAVVNIDDIKGAALHLEFSESTSIGKEGEISVTDQKMSLVDTEITISYQNRLFQIYSGLIGEYNIANMLMAFGIATRFDIDPEILEHSFRSVKRIPGRLEWVKNSKHKQVFIDYAHTPDAIENVLKTVRSLISGKLIAIIGAGGDRDQSKRAPMSAAAARYSDLIILTSDNPRSEDPEEILNDLEIGLDQYQGAFLRISDRQKAIWHGVSILTDNDLLVICGKGHENYQIIDGQKHHFSDYEEVQLALT